VRALDRLARRRAPQKGERRELVRAGAVGDERELVTVRSERDLRNVDGGRELPG